MPLLAHQQILVAAGGLLLLLFLSPAPAHSAQDTENWVDQIVHRVKAEQQRAGGESVRPEYNRYLAQLDSVREALLRGHIKKVRTEMSRLVRMVGTKEGGISDSIAQSLLLYVGDVTPAEYLDESTKTNLRLVREMVTLRAEAIQEIPIDAPFGAPYNPQAAQSTSWQFGWMGKGSFNPLITLGAGVLALFAIGVIALLFIGIRGDPTTTRSDVQAKDRTPERLKRPPPPAQSPRDSS